MGRAHGAAPTERDLFHACTVTRLGSVVNFGFDTRLQDNTQHAFCGRASYFYVSAADARECAPADNQGVARMFLVRVLVGDTVTVEQARGRRFDAAGPLGSPGPVGGRTADELLLTSHDMDELNVAQFRTIVDRAVTPRAFAVLQSAQSYPAYLISYRKG